MRAPEAAKPAHRRCDDGPRKIEHGAALSFSDTAFPESHQEGDFADANALADLRLLGIGWNDCEKALAYCSSVVLQERLYARLFALGITGYAVNGRGPFDALHFDAVVFLPGGRFEFSRDQRDASGTVKAVIIPARDECGELADLAALNLESGTLALWQGGVAMLGEDQLAAPRIGSQVLDVSPDALAWLRNNRSGVVIVNPKRARWRLTAEWLAVNNAVFGARLREELRLPEPQIFVRTAA